jgi:hypothetical protein
MEGTAAKAALSLEQLAAEIHELKLRVGRLETGVAPALEPGLRETAKIQAATEERPATDLTSVSSEFIPILGKAVLGVAGAYLLRAIAEGGAIPHAAGVAAAVLYSAFWLISASRVRARGGFAVAAYAITAAIAICPMLFETTTRFKVLPPPITAVLLTGFMLSGAMVAWQRKLGAISWITTLAGVATAVALFFTTQAVVPLTASLLALAALVEFAACRDYVFGERWLPALGSDLFVLALTQLALRPAEGTAPVPIAQALVLQMGLLAIYLGSTVFRTLVRKIPMTNFEIGQSVLAFIVALSGALRVAHGEAAIALGVLCLLAGASCYLVAFSVFEHRDRRRNFRVYAVFAVLLLFAAGGILFAGAPVASTIFWSLPALLTALAARRIGSFTMVIHCSLYLLASASVSGLFRDATAAMIGQPVPAFPPGVLLFFAVAVTGLCFWLVPPLPAFPARVSAAVIAAVFCWGLVGMIAAGLAAAIGAESVYVPAIRTLLLCLLAFSLVLAVSRLRRTELLWLLYPLTTFVLYKLVTEDFPQGHPNTLAATLVICGGALILLPRRIRALGEAR